MKLGKSKSSNCKVKIGFLSRHPAPYRDDFLKLISRSEKLEVRIFSELAYDEGHAYWGQPSGVYSSEVLASEGRPAWRVFLCMLKRLVFGGFDYTFWPGFMTAPMVLCELVSILFGKKYVICTDCVRQSEAPAWHKWLKALIIRRAAAFIVGGVAGRRFFRENYGIPDERILEGVYSLNGVSIATEIDKRRERRLSIRRRYGMGDDDVVYLMVANMLPKRHYPITVGAFRRFAVKNSGCRFVICGRGDGLPELQKIAEQDKSIVIIPGVPFDEMLDLYAMSDIYVHGGREPASTALQIGAIGKMPLVSSKAVGFAWDLLANGITGVEVADFLDEKHWELAFEEILTLCDKWKDMGLQAREFSRKFDVDVVSKQFIEYFSKRT